MKLERKELRPSADNKGTDVIFEYTTDKKTDIQIKIEGKVLSREICGNLIFSIHYSQIIPVVSGKN